MTRVKIEKAKTEADRAFIRKWLQAGEVEAIAKHHKISESSARKILQGKFNNYDFLKACYEKALERASTFNQLREKSKQYDNGQ